MTVQTNRTFTCDMTHDCKAEVTHIGSKSVLCKAWSRAS
jgi:hypothetical protein